MYLLSIKLSETQETYSHDTLELFSLICHIKIVNINSDNIIHKFEPHIDFWGISFILVGNCYVHSPLLSFNPPIDTHNIHNGLFFGIINEW